MRNYTPFSGLVEHHLRIGDTIFYVPPTAISVHRQMKNQRAKILRARNSLPKESGYFDQVVELSIFFPDRQSINEELRPLLSQVKKCPFLPIENTYLNDIYKIEAVTISGVTIQTVPGFPNCLQAQIQCYAFNPSSYIYSDEDVTFDEMFNWELFRWYYMRNLDPEQQGLYATYYEPLYEELDDAFKFRIADMDELEAIKEWRHKKKKIIKEYVEEQRDHFWNDEAREEVFNQKMDELWDDAIFEYDLHYEDWDIPGLFLTNLSIGFENTITSLQLQDDAFPTHQYMGSQDTILMAQFKTNDLEVIASLESLIHRIHYMIRNYHKEISNGFLEFDHPLARLFGVKNVTIEDMQTTTIEGEPGAYQVTLTMIAYNRIERKLNEAQWLSESIEWNIDEFEDQRIWSLFGMVPDFFTGYNERSQEQGGYDEPGIENFNEFLHKAPIISPFMRAGRLALDMPMMEQMIDALKIAITYKNQTHVHLDQEDIKYLLYHEAVKQMFRMAEVYPDLELPTYGEVTAAGFDIENTNNGIFVEPDFFIKYKTGTQFFELLLQSMQQDYQTILRDGEGGELEFRAGNVTGMNSVAKQQSATGKKEYDEAMETAGVDPIAEELVDKGNLKPAEIEALIREKAKEQNMNQNLVLAFARAMDSELKQFYEEGTNAKQGKVKSNRPNDPVMMNKQFQYYTNDDGAVDGEYIGVMKVRQLNGTNVNMLGKNIEYNVETGVNRMAQHAVELERIFAETSTSSGRKNKTYDESYVYALFGLNPNNATDREKARFAGVVMLYLGFEKEYTALVKENKKPSSKIMQVVKNVLNEVKNEKQWTKEEIEKKTKDLPIKDFKTVGAKRSSTSAVKEEDYAEVESSQLAQQKIRQGMMSDMVNYDKRGRLVRAFPTFFLTFIDEGQFIGTVKLSDQFFQYQAVMDILYTNSRKEASSTLVLEMCNIFGSLDDAEKGMDLASSGIGEVFKSMTMPGAVAREAERSRHRNPNYYKSIMLRTGTRIHFRMGYGSNPMNFPTIMNGTITSIQNNGESITVIAQDDGIELTNKIRADVNETTDGGFLFSKKEPTEIVDELLTDSQGFFKNLWAGLSNKEFENHSLGIMHFGSQGTPQGWDDFKDLFLGGEGRTIKEINMNVYQTTGLTNAEHDKWWNRIKDSMGIGQADEPGINIGLFDKSVWDVLNICASIGDDHVVAVHPFGFRNTIFSGKTYFPLHYDYTIEKDKITGLQTKPFRQFRIYDSVTSIIDNSIVATEDHIRTVGVGVYMNEGEMDTTSPLYVDTNIWPEKQRVVNIDTTLNAQGVRLVEAIPLVGGLLNKPFKWYFDEGVAIKITARGLSDYVRDMYDGYLTVMGDPSVKPYDQMWIYDTYNDIVGPADVKEVTHMMNHDIGFITTLKPDAVVVNSDTRSMGLLMSMQHIAGSAMLTAYMRKKLRNSTYAGNLPVLNAVWAATSNNAHKMRERFKTNKYTGKFMDSFTQKTSPYKDKLIEEIINRTGTGAKPSDIYRWIKNGTMDKVTKILEESNRSTIEEIINHQKKFSFSAFNNPKIKQKASTFMAKNLKHVGKAGDAAKAISRGAKTIWGAVHGAAGPVGWLAYAIEMLVVHVITSTVSEFIERWLFMRQCCLISPLTKGGLEFTAGINGHKGSVVGDSPDFWQGLMTNEFSALLLGFLGVDARQYSQEVREGGASTQSTTVAFDTKRMVNDLFHVCRSQPHSVENLSQLYENDRKAALEQVNRRLELLGKREVRANYSQESNMQESKTFEEVKDAIKNWFSNLFEKVKDFFGGSDDGTVCTVEGDVSTGGKATGLSKYFDVIGPKIEKEAEKQGLGAYAEIIKAKCMQESGGNYIKYPDVMQASESMGKPIGYIKDVDQSIAQGVKYFGQVLKKANGDIKLALQSYNFGSGFIDYVKQRGGKYTPELAYSFAEYMVQKMGRKISSIPPGYGDSKYVERVLRYYSGGLPSGECSNAGSAVTGGASSCPSDTSYTTGVKKYRVNSTVGLVDLSRTDGPWKTIIVGGTAYVRPGTLEALRKAVQLYGKNVVITSAWRKGDTYWHATGWAVDIDTPNTMRYSGGKLRFPNGSTKNDARRLAECCIQAGFRRLYFGDWDIVQEMNKKYGSDAMVYEPSEHHNHLHLSYPICAKK